MKVGKTERLRLPLSLPDHQSLPDRGLDFRGGYVRIVFPFDILYVLQRRLSTVAELMQLPSCPQNTFSTKKNDV